MALEDRLPCRKCGQPHEQRIAYGGGRTWQAQDGHAYDMFDPASEAPPRGRHLTSRIVPRGFVGVFFGTYARCERCQELVLNDGKATATHSEWHDEDGGGAP